MDSKKTSRMNHSENTKKKSLWPNKHILVSVFVVFSLVAFSSLAYSQVQSSQLSASTSSAAASTASTTISSGSSGSVKNFRFVVWPDTHTDFEGKGVSNPALKATEAVISQVKPSFVLHIGDMIDISKPGSSKDPKLGLMWSNFDKHILDPIIEANILFFPTPGNHDYHGARDRYKQKWSQFQNKDFKISGPEGYASYYSFDFGNSHFISLTSPGTRKLLDSDNQLAWLKEDLASAKKKDFDNIFVFTHSPLFCPKLNNRCDKDMLWLAEREVLELYKQYDVVHFGGHMHVYHDSTYEGVRSIICGMLGGGRRKLSGKSYQNFQFLVVDVDGSDFRIYPVEYPSMDISKLPSAPEVSAAQLASADSGTAPGLGGCPPGQMPASMLPSAAVGAEEVSAVPVGEAMVTEDEPGLLCSYCGASKRYLDSLYPGIEKDCKGKCCLAKCPPGTRLNNKIPALNQGSSEFGTSPCGGKYSRSGCGMVSFKMIFDGYGKKIPLADYFCPKRPYFLGSDPDRLVAGWYGIKRSSSKLGHEFELVDSDDWDAVVSALQSGKAGMLVLADKDMPESQRERCFDTSGHWIALVGASPDFVIANDPGGNCGWGREAHMVLSRDYFQRVDKNGNIIVFSPEGQAAQSSETVTA